MIFDLAFWSSLWLLLVPLANVLGAGTGGNCCCPGGGCGYCTGDTAEHFEVTLSGIADQTCGSCGSFNTTFILDKGTPFDSEPVTEINSSVPCNYTYDYGSICGVTVEVRLVTFASFPLNLVEFQVILIFNDFPIATSISWVHDFTGSYNLDCTSISGQSLAFFNDNTNHCVGAASTCTVTSG